MPSCWWSQEEVTMAVIIIPYSVVKDFFGFFFKKIYMGKKESWEQIECLWLELKDQAWHRAQLSISPECVLSAA